MLIDVRIDGFPQHMLLLGLDYGEQTKIFMAKMITHRQTIHFSTDLSVV